jgi:hypothetical protein
LIDAGVAVRILSSSDNGKELEAKAIDGGIVDKDQAQEEFFKMTANQFKNVAQLDELYL